MANEEKAPEPSAAGMEAKQGAPAVADAAVPADASPTPAEGEGAGNGDRPDRPSDTEPAANQDAETRPAARPRGPDILSKIEKALLGRLDDTMNELQRARLPDEAREHVEILRGLLKAQVVAYLEHFTAHKAALFSSTSTMYAGEVGEPGVISTTLRGLIEGNTLSTAQARRIAGWVSARRSLLIFGDRATGKSTLLNALFELVSVDERFVSFEGRQQQLPALKERSFCVRLSLDNEADLGSLFAKAEKMQPSRVVMGELRGDEVLHFFDLLYRSPKIGGFSTLRADSVHEVIDKLVTTMETFVETTAAKRLVAQTHPALIHMHGDENGRPRVAALWSVEGLDSSGEVLVREETATIPAAELAAEA